MDLFGAGAASRTKTRNIWRFGDNRRRQRQCIEQTQTVAAEKTRQNFSNMASCSCKISPIIPIFVAFLLVLSVSPVAAEPADPVPANQTFRPGEELQKLNWTQEKLRKINKPPVKTIQSPDGDLIDCVLSHHQPAFDHPNLQGQKPLDPPERPKGHKPTGSVSESFQLWTIGGESCPDGTIPIRRTNENDILRASSVQKFGRKARRPAMRAVRRVRRVRRDSTSSGHEHAVGYVMGDQYYGAKASLNVWAPHVVNPNEFSLSQMWVISGSFGDDLNTIEAGWQVSPELYGDNYPRFFTYWTTDAYQATGCYNLLCSGFVQTNNKIAIGAAISPTSAYNGGQFDISLLVWKDPNHGNWWLEFGSGLLVGYWPDFLFSHLRNHGSMVQFGGETVNTRPNGFHTSTQMGSGHFAGEGFGKASYFRNLQVVDWDNNLIPLSNLRVLADHPNCYDIQGGINSVWGNYFYYGGPGRNMRCP
ncbi:protein neprosin-like [Aristolochia californica]|uniref:protein neprosin-like n=1 Tax=Aristolochia californica TaxID=171875 RepID=UPI0035E10A79